ncbi:signal transduction histidine kinase [Halarchaeum rubridurum]|uniref:Signal transduction histidine kinase n=1 Tax=Halarchaeum rubridurum TaxID=489911 RepID=A0A830FM34_9EURY|nr:glycosyltransferase family 39 protein [Halarchaeum rubridurum]MBP1954375.1 signal transduction histidine kinase [Halarchaeum rubridurum]GGM60464.1 hypothetical protein GCM10009017_08330 [Halarchaeum rubridurum]
MLSAILSVGLLYAVLARSRSRLYRRAGGVALAGHVFVAVVVLPAVPYDWDVALFHANALRLLAGGASDPFSAVDAFAVVQALVYAVFGTDTTALAVVNGLFAVLTPLPLCALAERLYPDREGTDGLLLLALFCPLPFLFASLPMRDALSTLLAVLLLAVVVRAATDRAPFVALLAPPLWGALFLLREELALLGLLAGCAAGLVVAAERVAGVRSLRALLPLAVPVGLVGVALFALVFPVDALDARLRYRAMGSAAYLDHVTYDTWLDVLLAAPIRALYFQFAPFPLHVGSAFDLLAAAALPLVVALAVAAYRCLTRYETEPAAALALLVFYGGGVVGYGLIDANFGTTVRHRAVFVFVLGVFAAPALQRWVDSLRERVETALDDERDERREEEEAEELDRRAERRREHGDDADEHERGEPAE